MKKIWSVVKTFFLGIGANSLINEGGDFLDTALDNFYKEDPVACVALVKSVYAFVPFLQRLTAKTETPLDDKAVEEIKAELEEFAAQYNVTL